MGPLKKIDRVFEIIRYEGWGSLFSKIESKLSKKKTRSQSLKNKESKGFSYKPLVSVLVVNYNGAEDLHDFFSSLSLQTYENFELIFIDNASRDNSVEVYENNKFKFKRTSFIQSSQNLGFAEANNVARDKAKGELFAVINPDTRLSPDWLFELVDQMGRNPEAAAVTSKTLFWSHFCEVKIEATQDFELNLKTLLDSLEYKKCFYDEIHIDEKNTAILKSIDKRIVLKLPVQETGVHFEFAKCTGDISLSLNEEIVSKSNGSEVSIIELSKRTVKNPMYVINNAGSGIMNNNPFDIGFGEFDEGQYDTLKTTSLFCGCSVLIRNTTVLERPLFIKEFFAYYEDSELSQWLRKKGYNIIYNPKSVVYHRHSSSSTEKSPLWYMLVERSRAIFNLSNKPSELESILKQNEETYRNSVPESIFEILSSLNKNLISRLEREAFVPKVPTVGIYNENWRSMGGGEAHALSMISSIDPSYKIYLISSSDFDIESMQEYYNIDTSRCRKIVDSNFNSESTKKFDIFINSSFCSSLVSKAKESFYIVSFPHRNYDSKFLKSYTFLYNSDYTKRWSIKMWGKVKGDTFYPIRTLNTENSKTIKQKKKKILAVGRFTREGHCKNHHLILEAFKKLDSLNEWNLVLVGSLNEEKKEDVEYFSDLVHEAEGHNVRVIANLNRNELNELFLESAIYIHAAGLGQNPNVDPDKFEHFGITVLEAMVYGCIPIVYSVGGPAELTEKIECGFRYSDTDELVSLLKSMLKDDPHEKLEDYRKIAANALNFIESEKKKELPFR